MNKTDKYERMITAFAADFELAVAGEIKLAELDDLIAINDDRLLADIEDLRELEDGLIRGKLVILDKEKLKEKIGKFVQLLGI